MKGSLSVAVVVSAQLMAGTALGGSPNHPFPQHLTYAPGTIFPNHRTQGQLDDDVRAAYASWKARYLAQAGTEPGGQPRYRVLFSTDPLDRTVSEGQGYGMIIVALLAGHDPDAQAIFDGLWGFVRDHRSSIDSRLMDLAVPAGRPSPVGTTAPSTATATSPTACCSPTPSGDRRGAIDYGAQALDVLAGVLGSTIGPTAACRCSATGSTRTGRPTTSARRAPPTSCPATSAPSRGPRAIPSGTTSPRPSSRRSTRSRRATAPLTGLLPDFVVPVSAIDHTPCPRPPGFLEGPNDGDYYYNAGRDPWRLGTDALLNADPISRAQAQRIAVWTTRPPGTIRSIRAGYLLDGTPLPGRTTSRPSSRPRSASPP